MAVAPGGRRYVSAARLPQGVTSTVVCASASACADGAFQLSRGLQAGSRSWVLTGRERSGAAPSPCQEQTALQAQ